MNIIQNILILLEVFLNFIMYRLCPVTVIEAYFYFFFIILALFIVLIPVKGDSKINTLCSKLPYCLNNYIINNIKNFNKFSGNFQVLITYAVNQLFVFYIRLPPIFLSPRIIISS